MKFRKWYTQDEEGYFFYCPGCDMAHTVWTKGPSSWEVTGEGEDLSFSPSILLTYLPDNSRCHSYVQNGKIYFQEDCTHGMKGLTVPLPHFPSDYGSGDG